jgi:hypothetical protein
MQKISLEEEVDMLTRNLLEIIHNFGSKNLGKEVLICNTTSNDYVQAFRQLALYYVFLHNGHSRTGLDRDEL